MPEPTETSSRRSSNGGGSSKQKSSEADSKKTKSNSKPRSRKRRNRFKAEDNQEDINIVKKLKKKAGEESKTEKVELPPHIHKKTVTIKQSNISLDSWSIHNPGSYNRLVNRLEESQMNKISKPEGEIIDGPWKCALCGLQTCRESLGDLFGPYYQKVEPETLWPPSIEKPKPVKKGKKTAAGKSPKAAKQTSDITDPVVPEKTTFTDLWFHGDCLVWSPNIFLRGPQLVGIEEHIVDYWDQKCDFCSNPGASITCSAKGCEKAYHYPCGISHKGFFKSSSFDSWCPKHAAGARRAKSNKESLRLP